MLHSVERVSTLDTIGSAWGGRWRNSCRQGIALHALPRLGVVRINFRKVPTNCNSRNVLTRGVASLELGRLHRASNWITYVVYRSTWTATARVQTLPGACDKDCPARVLCVLMFIAIRSYANPAFCPKRNHLEPQVRLPNFRLRFQHVRLALSEQFALSDDIGVIADR